MAGCPKIQREENIPHVLKNISVSHLEECRHVHDSSPHLLTPLCPLQPLGRSANQRERHCYAKTRTQQKAKMMPRKRKLN